MIRKKLSCKLRRTSNSSTNGHSAALYSKTTIKASQPGRCCNSPNSSIYPSYSTTTTTSSETTASHSINCWPKRSLLGTIVLPRCIYPVHALQTTVAPTPTSSNGNLSSPSLQPFIV